MKSRPAPLAKLSRPRLFDAVPRERLFERMDTHRQRPVIWIAGQPGSGKTTLVASYLASRKLGGLWYQADSADADPASFFYFAREASRQRPVRGTANPEPPLLGSEHLQDLPLFGRLFFRALFQRLRAPAVIVIDNYQEIPESSPLHGALAAAMEEVPEGISVLFLSWSAPPPAYARLLAHGGMAHIGWPDLRLTLDEAQAIANSIRAMDAATVKGFHERTDGWAAGAAAGSRAGCIHRTDPGGTRCSSLRLFRIPGARASPGPSAPDAGSNGIAQRHDSRSRD